MRPSRVRPGSTASGVHLRTGLLAGLGLPIGILAAAASSGLDCGPPCTLVGACVHGSGLLGATLLLDMCLWASALRAARRGRPGVDFGVGPDWVRVVPATDPYRAHDAVETIARGSPAHAVGVIVRAIAVRAVLIGLIGVVVLELAMRPVCHCHGPLA